jgi:hypothetical protein
MPLYYYVCSKCYQPQRKIQTPEEATKVQVCGKPVPGKTDACKYTLRRDPRPPSSRVTEVLDNGAMNKRLERLADAERLFSERNEVVKKQQFGEKPEEE